ncbi:hypothetical protein MLD38_032156 [Melastoma candidum]|uniref:Uncharacterized protein n=1 Tax=Melastoma candidum TaxID=119954 RepID=A0ACB9M703_9MYRT|nr:hypothetical protein MLD38_032156 [Melastoma candidum]
MMVCRLPLLLILASLVFKPCVDATRYHFTDAALNIKERSLQEASTSQIVLLFDVVDNTPADSRLKKEIGHDYARKVLEDATGFALEMLDEIPFLERVSGHNTDCGGMNHSSIRLNSDYLEMFKGDVKSEFEGIIYHETTKVWKWNRGGQAPK